jgi:biopolymer transport protein ExbD
VFFLLVNSSDGEVLPSTRSVQLPESVAEDKPRETVVVMVTDTDILLDGHKVASVADVAAEEFAISTLKLALDEQSANALRIDPNSTPEQREITIMGNKTVPFSVLKKVMATCTDAGYGHVSLAVYQRAPDKG